MAKSALEILQELIHLGQVSNDVAIILLVLAWFAVSLRLWARFRITKSPGWDDVAMIASLLLYTTYCSFALATTFRYQDTKNYTIAGFRTTLLFIQFSEVFYVLTTSLLKVSLGLFFLRLLTQRWQTILFRAIIWISLIYGIVYAFIIVFQCGNPAHLEENLLTSRKCLPKTFTVAAGYLYGSINALADWTFVLIPIFVLSGSELDRKSKFSVGALMALGAIGSVSCIMRMVYLSSTPFGTSGISSASVKASIWGTAEPGTGIIAASIAVLRPLFRKVSTEAHMQISKYQSHRAHSRSASYTLKKGSGGSPDPESMQELTIIASVDEMIRPPHSVFSDRHDTKSKNMSIYSARSDAPLSPDEVIDRANALKAVSIEMLKARGSLVPERV